MARRDTRKRSVVKIDVSEADMQRIDAARGNQSRAGYVRQRVFLSKGFGDPLNDTCAKLIGTLLVLNDNRYPVLFKALDAVCLFDAQLRAFAKSPELDQHGMVDALRELRQALDPIAILAADQNENIVDLLGLVRNLNRQIGERGKPWSARPKPQKRLER